MKIHTLRALELAGVELSTPWFVYPRRESEYALNKSPNGPRGGVDMVEREESLTLPGTKFQSLGS